jgi:mono/diheme cytochrome c family protein
MRKSVWVTLGIFAFGLLTLSACSALQTNKSSTPTPEPSPPAEYLKMSNPYADQADAIQAGSQVFSTHCATCHGATGRGDGPTGLALNPRPADLTHMNPFGDTDGYIFWRISEGGGFAPFNSAMPAWKNTLSETQIWQVIAYLRTIEK